MHVPFIIVHAHKTHNIIITVVQLSECCTYIDGATIIIMTINILLFLFFFILSCAVLHVCRRYCLPQSVHSVISVRITPYSTIPQCSRRLLFSRLKNASTASTRKWCCKKPSPRFPHYLDGPSLCNNVCSTTYARVLLYYSFASKTSPIILV